MQLEPSLLAAACICSATRGLNVSSKLAVGYDLCSLTMTDMNKVEFIVKIIEEIVAKEIAEKQTQQQVANTGSCKEQYSQQPQKLAATQNGQQPETPTDVQFIYF